MASSPKTTTTKVEPWDGAKGYLTDIYADYSKALEHGKPQYYQGNTIADQSAETVKAQQQAVAAANNANNNGYLNNAAAVTNNVANTGGANVQAMNTLSQLQGGINVGTDPTMGNLASLLNGQATGSAPGTATYNALQTGTNPGTAAAQSVYGASSAANPTTQNLNSMASGQMIGANQYLQQSVQNATQSIADQLGKVQLPGIASQAAQMGRSGSGAMASIINDANTTAANQMSKVATDMYANQYNNDINSMLGANSQVSSNWNTDFGNKLNAAQNLGNSYAQQAQTQMAAAGANDQNYQNKFTNLLNGLGQMSGQYNQGVANQFQNAGLKADAANAANGASNANAQNQLAAAGQAGNAYQNTLLPADTLGTVGASKDQRSQDALNALIDQWDFNQQMPLTQLANFASILNGGGYSTQTSKTTGGSNGFGQILGGLVSGAGLLTSLSDRNAKENIKYLGEAPSGHRMYEYNYKGEDRKYIGPMAQDIAETDPDMAFLHDGQMFIRNELFDRMAG